VEKIIKALHIRVASARLQCLQCLHGFTVFMLSLVFFPATTSPRSNTILSHSPISASILQ
jgi:hypothetical protein